MVDINSNAALGSCSGRRIRSREVASPNPSLRVKTGGAFSSSREFPDLRCLFPWQGWFLPGEYIGVESLRQVQQVGAVS